MLTRMSHPAATRPDQDERRLSEALLDCPLQSMLRTGLGGRLMRTSNNRWLSRGQYGPIVMIGERGFG